MIGQALALAFICCLIVFVAAFVIVFFRIAFAKPPPPSSPEAVTAELIEHGFAMSEIGLAWAEVSRCPGLELRDEWGAGRLALAIRKRLEEIESSRAGGEAADTAQGQRRTEAEGHGARAGSTPATAQLDGGIDDA